MFHLLLIDLLLMSHDLFLLSHLLLPFLCLNQNLSQFHLTQSKAKQLVTSSPHALVSTLGHSSVHETLLDSRWAQAMKEEFLALQRNNTWDLVPFSKDMNLIGCKCVFWVKYNSDGSIFKHKTRLVAKSFLQMLGIDYEKTFSLVVNAP